jgi:hypothetical protein
MKLRLFTAALMLFVGTVRPGYGWSESGHHLIAVLAFDLLTEQQRTELLEILAAHPRYAEDFTPPAHIAADDEHARWRIGTAGYWPDIARSQPLYDRPSWHYQLGPTRVVGDRSQLNVPTDPGPLPDSATLQTQELHIAQALELCRRTLADPQQPAADRALALCWLAHLVADAHQPCHAGSLYVEGVFPEGDRGANSIPVLQGRNLHALWDNLLGNRYDAGDIRRRMRQISRDEQRMQQGAAAAQVHAGLEPHTWLAESRKLGAYAVYSPEVMDAIAAVSRGLTQQVEVVDLPEEYLQRAGGIARTRAAEAAHRLAGILREALQPALSNE